MVAPLRFRTTNKTEPKNQSSLCRLGCLASFHASLSKLKRAKTAEFVQTALSRLRVKAPMIIIPIIIIIIPIIIIVIIRVVVINLQHAICHRIKNWICRSITVMSTEWQRWGWRKVKMMTYYFKLIQYSHQEVSALKNTQRKPTASESCLLPN